jgi:hypothetical protein
VREREASWYTGAIPAKIATRHRGRYYKFAGFKGVSSSGSVEHREMFASSPTTAAAEAWALEEIRRGGVLPTNENVYSYRWPDTHWHARSYVFYAEGYVLRNQAIQVGFSKDPNLVAHCFDIKSFYPSIPRRATLPLLERRLVATSVDPLVQRRVLAIAEAYLGATPGDRGIAVGPALSHVFGNLALELLDEVMGKKYGPDYFRYVDDVVVLAPPNESSQIGNVIENVLRQLDLQLSDSKRDLVEGRVWLESGPHLAPRGHRTFENLIRILCYWVAVYPDRLEEVEHRLADAGLRLPVQRCLVDSRYSRFRMFARGLLRRDRALMLEVLRATPAYFCTVGLALRRQLEAALDQELSRTKPSGLPGKWWEQRVRYAANRLLYLTDTSTYARFLGRVETVPCLVQTAAVLRAVVTGNLHELLLFPGAAVATAAALLPRAGIGALFLGDDAPQTPSAISAVMDMVLHGLVDPPDRWIAGLNDEQRHVMRFCQGAAGSSRTWSGFSYGDEVRTLGLGSSSEDMRALVARKFDYTEAEDLPALDLGSHYS